MTIDDQNATTAALDRATRALAAVRRIIASQNRPKCPDAHELVQAIAAAFIPVPGGLVQVQVASIVSDEETYLAYHAALESQGIALTEGRPGPRMPGLKNKSRVFFDLDKVRRFLLRGNQWRCLDCEQLLLRVRDAYPAQRKLDGKRVTGIEIPLESWKEALATAAA